MKKKITIPALTKILASMAGSKMPALAKVKARVCSEADDEHKESDRQFMHTGHHDGVICYARVSNDLVSSFKVGLIAHELGHIALVMLGYVSSDDKREDHDEDEANHMGFWLTGIPVFWRGRKVLEWSPIPASLRKKVRDKGYDI